MKHPPKDSQWEAIRDTEHHLLVTAGAGTGKTHTVVGKVLYLLGVPVRGDTYAAPITLADIAAITYTNQAAVDLKDKLRQELRNAHRRESASAVEDARIGTIHSFCKDILAEFALRGGQAPASTTLSETESRAMVAEAARDTLTSAIEHGPNDELGALLAQWPLQDVTTWVSLLAQDEHQLAELARARHVQGPRERALLDLAASTHHALQDRLRKEASIDFQRMITWARDLIRDAPGVRDALRRRIQVLIVDEFQDVDPVQKEIAYLLADPLSKRTDTPRLMFVGDPKQSIYRFRGADVTVWRQVEKDFASQGCGRIVKLKDNFRSVAPILAFVEATIGRVLDTPIQGTELQDFEAPFLPVALYRHDGARDRAVEFILVASPDGHACKVATVRATEAEAVASRMHELHAPGGARWKDMAILLTTWSDLDTYQSALRWSDIPSYALRDEGFYSRREVVDLILALEVLRDPRNDVALTGFLRSPFVGVKDETLLAMALDAQPPLWDTEPPAECAERVMVTDAFAMLARFAAMRDRLPAAALLQRLLEETGYLAHLALLGQDGLQPLANVRKFLGLLEASRDESLGDFLRGVREARDADAPEGDARLRGSADDVVTITSVHSAKGLEWKIVFWCDLVRASQNRDGKLLLTRDAMVLGTPDTDSAHQSPEWQALHAALRNESAAEEKRVWYVASTRAKDRLILSGIPQGDKLAKNTLAAQLIKCLPALADTTDDTIAYDGMGARYEAIVHIANPLPEPDVQAIVDLAPVLPAESLVPPRTPLTVQAGRARHSATELLLYARCPRKHWFTYIAGVREPAIRGRGDTRTGALAHGQIVHDVLEQLEQEADIDTLLQDAIGRVDDDTPLAEGAGTSLYRQRVHDEIARLAADPAYRAIADLPTARRELKFLHIANEHAVAEGAMDLAAATPDGLVILDVKTTQGDATVAAQKAVEYAPQRDVYVAAAEGISGLPVHRFAFQFTDSGAQISATLSEHDRQEARHRFEQRASEAADPNPPLTRFPSECLRCGYRAVGWCEGVKEAVLSSEL